MKNWLTITLLALAILMLFLLPWWGERKAVKNYQRQVDSLSRVMNDYKAEAATAWQEMEFYQARANAYGSELAELKKDQQLAKEKHHRQLQALRQAPPVQVITTNIRMAECDSCMEVGQKVARENEVQAMKLVEMDSALASCQRGYLMLDTALKVSEDRFDVCEKNNKSLTTENEKLKVITALALSMAVIGILF